MRRVVLTGGPGAGKTTLLCELARRGYDTVGESAREVIAERLSRGESPRPDPETFAREILRRDMQKLCCADAARGGDRFYDRCAVEALGMLHEAAPLSAQELEARLGACRFHNTVFVLPPWQAIYRTDAERDHSFEHAQRVHESILRWYRRCGYEINEVPRATVQERADHVLQRLANEGDA